MTITPQFLMRQHTRFWKNLYFSARIRKRIDRTHTIKPGDVLLLALSDRWDDRLAQFCNYYRALGVSHFLFIDHGKDQQCRNIVRDMDDVSVFSASGKRRQAGNGYEWRNIILKRYATRNFCLLADPGEYLVFPFKEDRAIGELANFLKNERKDCLHGIMIDGYSRNPDDIAAAAGTEDDPFAICPYFDRDGYYHRNLGAADALVKGGPSLRLAAYPEPNDSPAINRVVGVWWRWSYYFINDGRTLRPPKMMRIFDWKNPVVNVAMFRFPEIEARQGGMPHAEMITAYGKEVANAVANNRNFYVDGISEKFSSSSALMEMGIISSGNWI
jgi:hypothetical protein